MLPQTSEDLQREARRIIDDALAAGQTALNESQAKSLLTIYGIPVPCGSTVEDEDDALDAARRLGYPVVMKAVGSEYHHKTEHGLVVLNVSGDEAVRATFARLRERAGRGCEGVLVEKMIAAEREFIVGMKRDVAFGPVVAFGVGGVMAEALADVAVAVAPVDDSDGAELLTLIRARNALDAIRGYPPVDRASVVDILKGVGQLALDVPEIAEIDINPLLTERGLPIAADALVVFGARKGGRSTERRRMAGDAATMLQPVFSPRSVAIVGASSDSAKWGGSLLQSIVMGGYSGEIYPINPRGGEFFGRRVYTSLADAPSVPDLVLVAIAAPQVAATISECGRRGIPAAVVIAAGFSETGPEGAALEEAVGQAADETGMTLVGPNTMGLISNGVGLHATGFVSTHPCGGGLSVISQSGNVGYKILKLADSRGVGIARFIGVGNEARVTSVDVLEYLENDPSTHVVLMYLEGVEDGRRLMGIARRTARVKPIVVVRGGMTQFGSRAAASHTGALAGTAAVREAAARQVGVMGTTSPEEGIDLALSLVHLPLPRGPRVAIVTLGGGWGVLAADELARNGLVMADMPCDLLAQLDEILPPFWSHGNPVDLVAAGDGKSIIEVVEHVAACGAVDALLILGVVGSPASSRYAVEKGVAPSGEGLHEWDQAFLKRAADLMARWEKPIVNVPLDPIERAVFPFGGRYPSVVLSTPRAGAQVLGHMSWYSGYLQARGVSEEGNGLRNSNPGYACAAPPESCPTSALPN